jgi:YD repeat-containing protein
LWRIAGAVLIAFAMVGVVANATTSGTKPRVVGHSSAARPGVQPPIVGEVEEERTPTSRTYDTEGGGRTVKIFPEPVHFKNADGEMQTIDNDLAESPVEGFAGRNRANRYRADFPEDAGRAVRFAEGGDWARFALNGAGGAGARDGEQMRYTGVLPAVDLIYTARPMGVKEELVLRDRTAPSVYTYDVRLSNGLKLREARDGSVEAVKDGDPVFRFGAPFAYDNEPGHHGDERAERDPHATLKVQDRSTLRLEIDSDWLSARDRAFPVVVDPTVTYISGSAKLDGAVADTYLSSDNPTASYGTNPTVAAGFGIHGGTFGHDHRALLKFDVAGAVPADSVVFSAQLGMYAERKENANLGALRVREAARAWTQGATWNTYDGVNPWTTPGGDAGSFASLGVEPGVGWNYWKDLQPMAERWVEGSSTNNGLLVERCCASPDNVTDFTSTNGAQAQWPFLQVWYTQRSGTLRQYSFWHPDGTVDDGVDVDRPQLRTLPDISVNVANGNLLMRTQERPVEAPGGVDLTRWYNSVWWGINGYGRGASLDAIDVSLWDFPDGNVRFNAPGYSPVLFKRKPDNTYENGRGLDATLQRATDGTTDFWVTLNETEERYVFSGTNNKLAKKYVDVDGNTTILANHSDGKSLIVTDGLGKVTTAFREDVPGSPGFLRIKSLQAPDGTWAYTYDANNNLSTVTAPGAKVTRFNYQPESGPNGEVFDKRLTKVTNPDGSEVRFTYTGPWGSRQVASYTTRAPGATVDGPTTRFSYQADRTVITDPSGKQTTYLWHAPTRRVTRIDSGTTPPGLTLSGTLYDRRDGTLADDGTKYTLTAAATSADSVKSIEVLIDGEQEDFAEQTCTAGCGMTRTFTLDPADFPSGVVTVSAKATTATGATRTSLFRVTVGGGTVGTAPSTDDPVEESTDGPDTTDVAPGGSPPVLPEDPARLDADKTAAQARYLARQTGPNQPPPTLLPTETFIFANANGNTATGQPPDPTGAVGPTRYIEMTNFRVRMYNKALTLTTDGSRALSSFMRRDEFVYDPQVMWDNASNRFFYAAATEERTSAAARHHLVWGWSRTSTPTDLTKANWCKFRTPRASTLQDDYPKLAVSRRHIIIGSNVFRPGSVNADQARLRVHAKPGRVADGQTSSCPSAPDTNKEAFRNFNRLLVPNVGTTGSHRAFTPVPVIPGITGAFNGYVVSADSGGGTGGARGQQIAFWRVVGTRKKPRLRNGRVGRVIGVDPYFIPTSVPQDAALAAGPPAPLPIDTSDARLTQAVGDSDPSEPGGPFTIWTQHTVEAPERDGRSVVRWYELNPAARTRVQQGTVNSTQVDGPQANTFVFNGAIAPAANGGDAAIHYNIGARDRRVEIHARSRMSTDTRNSMVGTQTVLVRSNTALDPGACNQSARGRDAAGNRINVCRWGDYAGASPDPMNPNVVWGTGMYIGDDRRYIARNYAVFPGTPSD